MDKPSPNSAMPQVAENIPSRPMWTSHRAYILTSIAMIVGLGNLWRFPYMAGENGGGVFVFAYVVCVLTFGIALHVLEISAGGFARRGAVGVFRKIHPGWGPWFGKFLILLLTLIMSYYLVISGWTLGYAVDSVRLDLRPFDEFTSGFASLWLLFAIAVLCFLVLMKGITGLERSSKYLLPVLVLIVIGLAVYTQTLPGAAEARQFYLSFDPTGLLEPNLWRMAASQAFYSLAIGQGLLFAYGSHTPRHYNKLVSSSAVAFTNSSISIIAGLMVFPIVFTFGIAPDAGSQLSFVAFPRMLEGLPGGLAIGIAFYMLLFLAAFTSCLGGLAAIMGTVRDQFHLSDNRAALLVVVVTTLIGIPSALSFTSVGLNINGTPFLDVIDQLTGSGVVVAAGISGAALISWMMPAKYLTNVMSIPEKKLGPVTFSGLWIIYIGRWLPVAAAILLLVTWLV